MPIPDGYVLSNAAWHCASGYVGRAQSRCQLGNGTCEAVQVLSGCVRLEPCGRPEVCSYNFSACPEPLLPGEECLVTCKRSYSGFLRRLEEEEEDYNESGSAGGY